LKRALILINAFSRPQAALNQPIRLKEELNKLGVEVDIKPNSTDTAMILNDNIITFLHGYDFVIYLDKDKYTSSLIEKAGIRIFNSHEGIRICDDKMDTHIKLSGYGIKMPDTIAGLLCYNKDASIDDGISRVELVEKRLGYPCVIKENYGSLGTGVYCANNRNELLSYIKKIKCKAYLFQEMIVGSMGKDVRVIVIGGKAICAMQRNSTNDFRSNIELGGIAKPFELTQPFIEMSEKVAGILGLDYCGIDILYGDLGEPILCEVNSNAFFGAIERITGVNIAGKYAEYIFNKIYTV